MESGETVSICSTLKNEKSRWARIFTAGGMTIQIFLDKKRCRLVDIRQCCGRIRYFQFTSQIGIWKQQFISCLSSLFLMFKNVSS